MNKTRYCTYWDEPDPCCEACACYWTGACPGGVPAYRL